MKILDRIADALDPTAGRNNTTETADTAVASGLYECAGCGTTYISTEMETCPDCRHGVEAVATERDLGLV